MDRSVVRLASAPHTILTAVFTLVAAHLTARTTQGLATHLMRPVMRSFPPKPYASWVLNEDTCLWDAPVPKPEDAGTG
jgi:hypothetical protein